MPTESKTPRKRLTYSERIERIQSSREHHRKVMENCDARIAQLRAEAAAKVAELQKDAGLAEPQPVE